MQWGYLAFWNYTPIKVPIVVSNEAAQWWAHNPAWFGRQGKANCCIEDKRFLGNEYCPAKRARVAGIRKKKWWKIDRTGNCRVLHSTTQWWETRVGNATWELGSTFRAKYCWRIKWKWFRMTNIPKHGGLWISVSVGWLRHYSQEESGTEAVCWPESGGQYCLSGCYCPPQAGDNYSEHWKSSSPG